MAPVMEEYEHYCFLCLRWRRIGRWDKLCRTCRDEWLERRGGRSRAVPA